MPSKLYYKEPLERGEIKSFKERCVHCGSKNILKRGRRGYGTTRYSCKEPKCQRWFQVFSDLDHHMPNCKYHRHVIEYALSLIQQGFSYSKIQECVMKEHSAKVSKGTISYWKKNYASMKFLQGRFYSHRWYLFCDDLPYEKGEGLISHAMERSALENMSGRYRILNTIAGKLEQIEILLLYLRLLDDSSSYVMNRFTLWYNQKLKDAGKKQIPKDLNMRYAYIYFVHRIGVHPEDIKLLIDQDEWLEPSVEEVIKKFDEELSYWKEQLEFNFAIDLLNYSQLWEHLRENNYYIGFIAHRIKKLKGNKWKDEKIKYGMCFKKRIKGKDIEEDIRKSNKDPFFEFVFPTTYPFPHYNPAEDHQEDDFQDLF